VDPLLVVLCAGLFLLGWVADGDEVEGGDALGDAEDLPHVCDAFLARVDAEPDGAEAEGGRGEEEVLGGGGAVLDPEALRCARVPADGESASLSSVFLSVTTTRCQGFRFDADGAAIAASRRVFMSSSLTGSGVYFLMLRREKIISISPSFISGSLCRKGVVFLRFSMSARLHRLRSGRERTPIRRPPRQAI